MFGKVRGEHIFVVPLQRIKSSQLCGPPTSELYNTFIFKCSEDGFYLADPVLQIWLQQH